jgi:hypothetical protein
MTAQNQSETTDWSPKHTRMRWGMVTSALLLFWVTTYGGPQIDTLPLLSSGLKIPKSELVALLALFSLFQFVSFCFQTMEESRAVSAVTSRFLPEANKTLNDILNADYSGPLERFQEATDDAERPDGSTADMQKAAAYRDVAEQAKRQTDAVDVIKRKLRFWRVVTTIFVSSVPVNRWIMGVTVPLLTTIVLYVCTSCR